MGGPCDYRSPVDWLSWHFGMGRRAAREYLQVARRLAGLPLIKEAFSRGELSFFQVAALARVATAQTERSLVEIARAATGSPLASLVRAYRRVLESADNEAANHSHARRHLHYCFDDDGFFVFSGRLDAEGGRVLQAALEAAVADLAAAAGGSGPRSEERAPGDARDSWAAMRADALVAMAEAAQASGLACRNAADRQQVIVHIDAGTLAGIPAGDGGGDGSSEHCEIEGGPAVAPGTARRIACDAAVVTLVEDAGGQPLSVGRKTRRISPALRRALEARDHGCVFPGCGERRFVEAHHIRHWAAGGETSLGNLASACWFHHRLVHEGGYRLERRREGLVFIRPNGVSVPAEAPKAGPCDGSLNVDVAPGTAPSLYSGGRLNISYALCCLVPNDSRLNPKPLSPPPPPETRAGTPEIRAEGP